MARLRRTTNNSHNIRWCLQSVRRANEACIFRAGEWEPVQGVRKARKIPSAKPRLRRTTNNSGNIH
jgi:hypothetical protein